MMRAADALPQVKLPGPVRESWRRHISRPWVPAIAIAGSVAHLLAAFYLGGAEPSPGHLARLFAPAPLDTFSDLRIAGRNQLLVPLLFVSRACLVTGFVLLIVDGRFRFGNLVRVAALQALSLVMVGLQIAIGLAYLATKSSASVAAAALLFAQPVVIVVLTRFLSPMVCRAAAGLPVRPRLSDARLWLYSAISGWLWMFTWEKASVYLLSFVIVLAHSVLFGAIALRSTQRTAEPISR